MPEKPSARVVGFVDRDPVNPGLQAALPSERPNVPEYLQENLLHYVGGFRRVVEQPQCQGIYRLLEPAEQFFVGLSSACAKRFHQPQIVAVGAFHSPLGAQIEN
jgi:hypothetical protein